MHLEKRLGKEAEETRRIDTIETTALLKLTRILRRVLETWRYFLSLRLQGEPQHVYRCTIARYGYAWNVHKMFITYIHRTQESRNTKNTHDFLVQVRNILLPLSLKILRHKERDTHSFYSGFSICTHPHPNHLVQHPPQRPLAWLRRASESQPSSPDAELNSTDFFKIPQILRALPVRDVSRTL